MRVHQEWLLTPERAAIHLPTATAVIADLHLGYDQARRRGGEAVPRQSVTEALQPLRSLLVRARCRQLVIAGDLFEVAWCAVRAGELVGWLDEFGVKVVGLVPGNHDRGVPREGLPFPRCPEGVAVGSWHVVHGDRELPAGSVLYGHHHPVVRWGDLTAPCYLVGAESLVLPAYSRDVRGVNVRHQARWRHHRCCVIAGTDVLDFGIIGHWSRVTSDR